MQALDLDFHSLIPIPLDLGTREGFFIFSMMPPDDTLVFPDSPATDVSSSFFFSYSNLLIFRSSF